MNKRLLKEFDQISKSIQSNQLKSVEILELNDTYSAIFLFAGPIDSPYEGFWFRIKLQWPSDYPFRPPKCTLLDKIWNPYVDFETNKICIDILRQQWCPQLTIQKIILSITSLLAQTKINESDDGFANPEAAIQMMKNYPQFHQKARKISQTSSYKHKPIYSDQMRGIQEQRKIEVESDALHSLIQNQLKSKKYKKKSQHQVKDYLIQNQLKSKQYQKKTKHSVKVKKSQKKQRQLREIIQLQEILLKECHYSKSILQEQFPSLFDAQDQNKVFIKNPTMKQK